VEEASPLCQHDFPGRMQTRTLEHFNWKCPLEGIAERIEYTLGCFLEEAYRPGDNDQVDLRFIVDRFRKLSLISGPWEIMCKAFSPDVTDEAMESYVNYTASRVEEMLHHVELWMINAEDRLWPEVALATVKRALGSNPINRD
ncbi:hypothetical protein PENTCL1PPCAC_1282, partial [Pristionchus entomophagus]